MGKDSMEENIRKKLYRFLKENGVYRAFINEFNMPCQKEQRNIWLSVHQNSLQNTKLNEYCEGMKEKNQIVNFAFKWVDSEQGHEFWEEISEKWKKYCRDNKI